MDVLTAPRQLVIRLEDSTKGVQRGDRVLAVFPDTTSFYVGVVHRVSGGVMVRKGFFVPLNERRTPPIYL